MTPGAREQARARYRLALRKARLLEERVTVFKRETERAETALEIQRLHIQRLANMLTEDERRLAVRELDLGM